MNRLLTPEQIDELHEFCYFRGVWHYDVQVEIVDHLGTAIEELWENNPTLPFDEAMYHVGDKFGGPRDFAAIKKEKEKALRKKYWRLLWLFAGDYYKFPKIVITLLLVLGLNSAFRFIENDQLVIVPLVVLLIGLSIFYRWYYFPKFVKIKTVIGYPFLLNEIAIKGILTFPVGLISGMSSLAFHTYHFSTVISIIVSFSISLFLILLYGNYFYIPKRIREHFIEQFPQFVKS